ncbi:MAG: SurA N-terminal domain-containing protein, partial [Sedimentisphaerales bacterium]|nr:SurA N-terminal domain-containing protein [Sedimentisphaerales bacterium]
MSLVRWFRKNNSKIMAIVVIVLMIGFVGGSALTYLLRGSRGLKDTVATITGRKISNNDLVQARQELELLRMLRADDLLRAQGLQGVFLAELLFSAERGGSSELINRVRQTIRQNLYPIS